MEQSKKEGKPAVIVTVLGRKKSLCIITPEMISESRFAERFKNGFEFSMEWINFYISLAQIGIFDMSSEIDLTFQNIDSVTCCTLGGIEFKDLKFEKVRQVCADCLISGSWDLRTVEEIRFTDAAFTSDAKIQFNPNARFIDLGNSTGLTGKHDLRNVSYIDLRYADSSKADLRIGPNCERIKEDMGDPLNYLRTMVYAGGR